MIRRFAVIAAALGLSLVGSESVQAQQKPAVPAGTAVKVDGTVQAVVPGQGIMVANKDGKKYGMAFVPASKVTMSGTASPDVLKPGMFVQFTVTLDGKMKPISEATKITIIEPSTINQPGVFSEKGPDGKPGEPGPFLVRGNVRSFRDGTLNVAAGSTSMSVPVASSATIPVTVGDWSLANPGDTITGDVNALKDNGQFTPVYAVRVEIKAIAPITGKKKK